VGAAGGGTLGVPVLPKGDSGLEAQREALEGAVPGLPMNGAEQGGVQEAEEGLTLQHKPGGAASGQRTLQAPMLMPVPVPVELPLVPLTLTLRWRALQGGGT